MSNQLIPINNALVKSANTKHDLVQKIMNELRSDLPELIPYRKGNKWGFCDRNKKIVIDCVYEKAHYFVSNLAVVTMNSIDVLINKRGVVVFKSNGDIIASWDQYYDFYMLTWDVESEKIDTYLIFRKNSEVSFDNSYMRNNTEQWEGLVEGLIAVELNNKWGFVNKQGDRIIECIFDEAKSFNNGYAKVRLGDEWFLINKNGSIVEELVKEEKILIEKEVYTTFSLENVNTITNSEKPKLIKPSLRSLEEEYFGMYYSDEKKCYIDLRGNEYWED